jgi:hypothetical protein
VNTLLTPTAARSFALWRFCSGKGFLDSVANVLSDVKPNILEEFGAI